jgi:hypothetical protein
MNEFKLHRLGMLMEPEPGNPMEVEGVLNPAAVRGPDGRLYLFPRMVAQGIQAIKSRPECRMNDGACSTHHHQRCQMICSASSGTDALGWRGIMRTV